MTPKNKIKSIAVNGLVAALYIVMTYFASIFNLAAGPIQFRISESLNHLIIFDRKYFWGISIGCVAFNAFFGAGPLDIIFGGGQTIIALLITIFVTQKIKSIWIKFSLNALFFSASMFMVAWMLHIISDKNPFWATYGILALSEVAVMLLSAPIMYVIDQAVHFKKRIN